MSKAVLPENETNKSIDYSFFIEHKLQLPSKKCAIKSDFYLSKQERDLATSRNDDLNTELEDKNVEVIPEATVRYEQYCIDGHKALIDWINKSEFTSPRLSEDAGKCDEIHKLTLLAEEALDITDEASLSNDCEANSSPRDGEETIVPHPSKFAEKRYFAEESFPAFREDYSSDSSYKRSAFMNSLLRDGDNQASGAPVWNPGEYEKLNHNEKLNPQQLFWLNNSPRSTCRHFIKGFCLRGESCNFLHDLSVFCIDDQKVFLGGLPLWLTPMMLKTKLCELGLTVLNYPKVLRGFCPELCLGSIQETMEFIARRYIRIGDRRVDVRPYQREQQFRDGIPNASRRTVFLGGLSEKTTGQMIIDDLWHLGARVVECPVVKKGYAPCVVLGSSRQAKMLVTLKRVVINGSIVNVRPYMIFKRYQLKRRDFDNGAWKTV